jgi:hypothetical protein
MLSMFDQKYILLNIIKNKKGPKTKIDFFLEKKIPLSFSDNIEGLNFLKNILVLSGSALQMLKMIPNTALFLGFFWTPKSH